MRSRVSVHRVHGVWFALEWVVLGPVMRFYCFTVMLVARDVLECVSAVSLASESSACVRWVRLFVALIEVSDRR